MSARSLIIPVLIGLACWILPEPARAQLDAGVVIWRQSTAMEAKSATDFDGSNETADARARDWDTQGSGFGIQAEYRFPKLVSVYLRAGLSQVTVRNENLADPNLNLNSLGFDDGLSGMIGARVGDILPVNENVFWSAGLSFAAVSSDMKEDVSTTWKYDEQSFALDGTMGYTFRGVGFYGGLRFVRSNADLEETDIANPVGLQVRRTELERDKPLDLLFGARMGSAPASGFVELGAVGAFSATAGFAYEF